MLFLRFLKTAYNSMSCGCPGILKSRSGMDVVSNRWESIISLFKGYIALGSRDIWILKFWNVTSSYLQYWVCSQILVFHATFNSRKYLKNVTHLQYITSFRLISIHFESANFSTAERFKYLFFTAMKIHAMVGIIKKQKTLFSVH